MKLCLRFFLLASLFSCTDMYAFTSSDVSKKWNKVTMEELSATNYDKDTSANAVVLYKESITYYDYNINNGFDLQQNVTMKLKILTSKGKDAGTIIIPYYYNSSNNTNNKITNIEAYTYNLVNGKIIKTKLDKDYIFVEKTNNRMRRVKFSLPDVKVGSVLEFKYTMVSPYIYTLNDITIQEQIPVLTSYSELSIPDYFDFKMAIKGFEKLDIQEDYPSVQYNVGNAGSIEIVSTKLKRIKCLAQDIPALENESFVWCLDDYRSGLTFELRRTFFPNSMQKNVTYNWQSMEVTLLDGEDLKQYLKLSNPWKTETNNLKKDGISDRDYIEQLFAFVKTKIKWNGVFDFANNNPKEAINNGTGDNAQINFILMSMLRDAGFKTYPILLSIRSEGRLPINYPSISKISTFIVGIQTKDSIDYYLDGSTKYGGVNVLDPELLTDRAYILDKTNPKKWIDLSKISDNLELSSIQATLNADGILRGVRLTTFTNQDASAFRELIFDSKDSANYVSALSKTADISIETMEPVTKNTLSESVNEQFTFTKKIEPNGDMLYINPLIFTKFARNMFVQNNRKLPVEFSYPYTYQLTTQLDLPTNFAVEELPKSEKFTLLENKGTCQFVAINNKTSVQFKFLLRLSDNLFNEVDYTTLYDFFGKVVEKNSEIMVLKRIVP